MSNYPDGVSDAHPYFNPPREIAATLECGADSAQVVPSFAVKAALNEITDLLQRVGSPTAAYDATRASSKKKVLERIKALQTEIDELEQEADYECDFRGEVDVEESECARWDCPVCGNERESDTMPEERDPDEEWERRNER